MKTMKRSNVFKSLFLMAFLSFCSGESWGQGNSCIDPIDLNTSYPIVGNGIVDITVDNSASSQFYTYTATQVGHIQMSSSFSNVPGDGTFDSYLRVYDMMCDEIVAIDNSPGLFGAAEFTTEVEIGDTYIFEWSNHEWAGVFDVIFTYHEPVLGESCGDPAELSLGANLETHWLGDQYFQYEAAQSGTIEITTCGLSDPVLYFQILDACDGVDIGIIADVDCDPEGDFYWYSYSYDITEGEQIIIKTSYEHAFTHADKTFNAVFTPAGMSCEVSIEISAPDIFDVAHVHLEHDNDQWYKFTAPKSGHAIVTTKVPSMASSSYLTTSNAQTNIAIYDACGGNLIAANDDYYGYFGASRIDLELIADTEYYILMIDEFINDPYEFEIFYEEDLIIGTEEMPLEVALGYNATFANFHYINSQWFSYEFTQSGAFNIEMSTHYDHHNNWTTFSANMPIIIHEDEDSGTPLGFTFEANTGDVLKFNLNGIASNTFTATFEENGLSCEAPIEITQPDIYDVAHIPNEDNDQWYKFTAPKSGSAIITTKVPSLASNLYLSGPNAMTNIAIYDACGGELIAANDDYVGYFGGSRIDLDLIADTEYYILMIDEWINAPYKFEIFFEEDFIIGTEESPLDAVLGYNGTFADLHYINSQWFSYEFEQSGEFNIELNTYNGHFDYWTNLFANQSITIYEEEDTGVPLGFTYTATAGDVLKFNLNGSASNTFTATFEEKQCQTVFTQLDEDNIGGEVSVDNSLGDHVFRYTATMDGTLFISNCNQGSGNDTYVKLYELCEETILAASDNFCGTESRLSHPVTSGITYEIVWDAQNIPFGTVAIFDFYMDYLENIPGLTQDEAIPMDEELYHTHTQHIEEQWFSYTLPENGVLNIAGFPAPGEENPNSLLLVTDDLGSVDLLDPTNATYTGIAGDQVYIVWNSNFSYQSIEFAQFFTADAPCADTNILTETACESYQFGEDLLTESGQYIGDYVNQAVCDSLVILNLTINASSTSTFTETACNEYDFLGTLLTATGIYNETITNSVGCDSLVTLNLTINESTASTLTETACGEYDFLGTLLTMTGTYDETLTNAVGCDSLVTLNLTINEPTTSTLTETACGEYDFLGTLLTMTGIYDETLTNAVGCDSLVTLNLTIQEAPIAIIEQKGVVLFVDDVDGATYQWVDCDNADEPIEGEIKRQLTPPRSGNYAVEVSNDNCVVTSECILFDWVLGTSAFVEPKMNIFPTVTSGEIQLSTNQPMKDVQVIISTLNGTMIFHKQLPSLNAQSVFINGADGIYVVQVIANNQLITTQKIIKRN
jgi:hypothetical protein